MKTVLDFFKHITEWISDKLKKDGIKNTTTSILFTIIIFILIMGYSDNVVKSIGKEIDKNQIEQVDQHQHIWMTSREMHTKMKTVMRMERPNTNADYIIFLDYHNGGENIATGYSFCKFDATLEVRSDTVTPLPVNDFKDENITHWDVLLTDRVINNKMVSMSIEEALLIDPAMVHKLYINEHTKFIVFYNITINNICAGTLLFIYKDSGLVDYGAVATCGYKVESTMKSFIMNCKNK